MDDNVYIVEIRRCLTEAADNRRGQMTDRTTWIRRARTRVLLGLLALGVSGVLLPASPAAATPAPAPAAQACSLTPTAGTVQRTIGSRSYHLRVPAGLTEAVPLLVSLHPYTTNGLGQETWTGWSTYADNVGFIVAYPNAANNGVWQTGTRNNGDVTFLRQLVNEVKATYCVDARRVYADGMSLGAEMSQRIGCEASDVFASINVFDGADPTESNLWHWFPEPCTPARPISILQSFGENSFGYAGGVASRNKWITRNGCSTTPTPVPPNDGDGAMAVYQPCNAGTQVLWRTWANQPHEPLTGARLEAWRNLVWYFFATNLKPA